MRTSTSTPPKAVTPAQPFGRVLEGVGTGIALPLMFNIITEQAP